MEFGILETRSRTDIPRMCSMWRHPVVVQTASSVRGWLIEMQRFGRARRAGVALADQTRSVDFIIRHAHYNVPATQAVVFEALATLTALVETAEHWK